MFLDFGFGEIDGELGEPVESLAPGIKGVHALDPALTIKIRTLLFSKELQLGKTYGKYASSSSLIVFIEKKTPAADVAKPEKYKLHYS